MICAARRGSANGSEKDTMAPYFPLYRSTMWRLRVLGSPVRQVGEVAIVLVGLFVEIQELVGIERRLVGIVARRRRRRSDRAAPTMAAGNVVGGAGQKPHHFFPPPRPPP